MTSGATVKPPAANNWIDWAGGLCPVPKDTLVWIKMRSGEISGPLSAMFFQWSLCPKWSGYDILAYCLAEVDEPKDANPKAAFGETKPPMHLIPFSALVQVAMVMRLGAKKYGAHNWRESEVRASTYVSALMRHVMAWFDGEGTDPESGMSHIAHAVACGLILLDAMLCGTFIDDRPREAPTGELIAAYTRKAAQ